MTALVTACYTARPLDGTGCSMHAVMWHPFVTCGHCGQIHECVRLASEPCSFTVLCHGCESMLSVTITAEQIVERRSKDLSDGLLEVGGAVTRRAVPWTEEHELS